MERNLIFADLTLASKAPARLGRPTRSQQRFPKPLTERCICRIVRVLPKACIESCLYDNNIHVPGERAQVPCVSEICTGSKCRNLELIATAGSCDPVSIATRGKPEQMGFHWLQTYTINQWIKRFNTTDHQYHAPGVAASSRDMERSIVSELKMAARPLPSAVPLEANIQHSSTR
jgi:hypothetical protein